MIKIPSGEIQTREIEGRTWIYVQDIAKTADYCKQNKSDNYQCSGILAKISDENKKKLKVDGQGFKQWFISKEGVNEYLAKVRLNTKLKTILEEIAKVTQPPVINSVEQPTTVANSYKEALKKLLELEEQKETLLRVVREQGGVSL